jgi:hypothetical protein
MKIKVITILLAIFIIGGGFFSLSPVKPAAQSAEANETEKSVQPAKAAAPAEDLFSAGHNVEVKSDHSVGDAAVAGANVRVAGKVTGYALLAGANVSVDAPVGNDLWAAGANVSVNAPVGDNVTLAGSSVILAPEASVGRDARIAANLVELKGRIYRNLNLTAADAQIFSEINGNVTANVEKLTLNPGAIVRGDLIVRSPNEPVISPEAKVLGRVEYHRVESGGAQGSASPAGGWFGSWFLSFLWLTILGLLAVWFSSVWTRRVADVVKQQTWKSLLTGFIAALVVPVGFLILLVTVVGLPLAFLLGALATVAFMFSGVFISYLVGDWALRQAHRWENSDWLKIVFGTLIVTIVMSLPWVGWLVKLAVIFFGAGAFLLERRDLLRQLRAQGWA